MLVKAVLFYIWVWRRLVALSLSAAGGGYSENEKAPRSKFCAAPRHIKISGTARVSEARG
ncbi:MAG: hypothetical protein IKD04_00045 [Clostridia bacterium]|nr:hypothetical protein [Clostridia bacterium]